MSLSLSPLAVETLRLIDGCSCDSLNAFGLSKLAHGKKEGSEWARTFEFQGAIEELTARGLLTLSAAYPNSSPEHHHYCFDRVRIRERLAVENVVLPELAAEGPRVRVSALAL